MAGNLNEFRWDGAPGHYEVYYLTLTDPATGIGLWIRYTMLAPVSSAQNPPSASLWFLAMDPNPGRAPTTGRKQTFSIEQLVTRSDPFQLSIADATLSDEGMAGSCEDCEWELRWKPTGREYEPVHPLLRRLGAAQTVLAVPHAHLLVEGTVAFDGRRLELEAPGGQSHLWGSKHALRWAWAHCNDFRSEGGAAVPDGTFVDGVSAVVRRLGREVGPNTPVVARVGGADFGSTSPLRLLSNRSEFELTRWRFEAVDGSRKLVGEVEVDRDQLAGVTYHDPDGEPAYCYNTEIASMRLHVYERAALGGRPRLRARAPRRRGWSHLQTLTADGRAHFEYAQRTPVPGLKLHTS